MAKRNAVVAISEFCADDESVVKELQRSGIDRRTLLNKHSTLTFLAITAFAVHRGTPVENDKLAP
jgi:hypothetical protein